MKPSQLILMAACLISAAAGAQGATGDIWLEPLTPAGQIYVDLTYSAEVWMNIGSTQPDTIQFQLNFDTSKLYLPFSVASGSFPPTFTNANIVMGPHQGVPANSSDLNLQVSHPEASPGIIQVVRQGGAATAGLPSTVHLFTLTFKPLTVATSSITGSVAVLRDGALNTVGTPAVVSESVEAQGRWDVYVDFETVGTQVGTQVNPYLLMTQAANGVRATGNVNITAGATGETLTITRAMFLKASGGTVTIGAEPGKLAQAAGTPRESTAASTILTGTLQQFLTEWLDGIQRSTLAGVQDETAQSGSVFETALPKSPAALAGQNARFAIRLRAPFPIDTLTVWGEASSANVTTSDLEIIPVAPDDLWVVFHGGEDLQPGDTLHLSAGANGLDTVTHTFTIIEAGESQEFLSQPGYTDFDTAGLDLEAESTAQSGLVSAQAPGLPNAVGQPTSIAPGQVFETPQRIWLPAPGQTPGADLQLFYYFQNDDSGNWYPAAQVEGWMVPGSELEMDLDGQRYYGFTVRHGGIVQLATAVSK